jgi:purine-nucleoside phosphorylase
MEQADALGIRLERGVYVGVHGPQMETPAETRMFKRLGADAVGMSTVMEVIAARHLSLRVLGFSCLTNKNLPDCMEDAPIEVVIAMANKAGGNLARLIESVVGRLA